MRGTAPDQGVGAHKDYGFLTLLLQDRVGGLQVQREDGLFHDVPPIPGAFVVNLGELLEVATDGYLVATNHRVVSPAGATERFSVPFFYNPRLDARVEPLPFPYASAAPGRDDDPANPLFAEYGRNELKGKLRAHPLVAARHHAELLDPGVIDARGGGVAAPLGGRHMGRCTHAEISGRCPRSPRPPAGCGCPARHSARRGGPAGPCASAPGCARTSRPCGRR